MKKYSIDMKFRRNHRQYVVAICVVPVLVMMLLFASCERRSIIKQDLPLAALIPVKIDWNGSGFPNGAGVHSVSIRFFPKESDGTVFDRYLETNVKDGEISVPPGRYSVIVFNEAINDPYYTGSITFSDENNYNNFAANAARLTDASRQQQFPNYKPKTGELFILQPPRLATWSLDNFEVTTNMILVSHGQRLPSFLTTVETEMMNALTKIVMTARIRSVTVTAQVQNLVSAQTIYLGMQGLASKVYMATGVTTQSPSTYLFTLNNRQYAANRRDGTESRTFLCFGRTPAPEAYNIAADILLITNDWHEPSPLNFPVTTEVTSSGDVADIPISLNISFNLPFIEGGIAIDSWGDDEHRTVIDK